jgi:hypothetical protein
LACILAGSLLIKISPLYFIGAGALLGLLLFPY